MSNEDSRDQDDASRLAEHVKESVDAVATFRSDHDSSASPLQKIIDRITDGFGRPIVFALLFAAVLGWTAGTFVFSDGRIDQPSFAWLEFASTLLALFVAALILVTQRHGDKLAERRAQLMLELALMSDRKNAKIIALLEELRRDMPAVANRIDAESQDMQNAADPRDVLDALDKQANKTT